MRVIIKYSVAISSFMSNTQTIAAKFFIQSMDVKVDHGRVRTSFSIRTEQLEKLITSDVAIDVSQQQACQESLLVSQINPGASMKKCVCVMLKTQ